MATTAIGVEKIFTTQAQTIKGHWVGKLHYNFLLYDIMVPIN